MKKIIAGSKLWSIVMITALVTACGGPTGTTATATSSAAASQVSAAAVASSSQTNQATFASLVSFDTADQTAIWSANEATTITLNGTTAAISGNGASAEAGQITITEAGTYVLKGELSDGQILVNVADKGTVQLVLNGVTIHNEDSAGIFVQKAGKAIITLADGTVNTVTDGAKYVYADAATDEPDAAIFSKADLTFNGTGKLNVTANYNDGITSKDELRIVSGEFNVKAANNGIKGKDLVAIQAGTFTIEAENDGIKSTNDTEADKGFVAIQTGTYHIQSAHDAIQAETVLVIEDGTYQLVTGGGSANAEVKTEQMPGGRDGFGGGDFGDSSMTPPEMGTPPEGAPSDGTPPEGLPDNSTPDGNSQAGTATDSSSTSTTVTTEDTESTSAKGLKAGTDLMIHGGSFTIDAKDDALHSNSSLTVNDGQLSLATGDDGLHADAALTINGGTIEVTQSYEGLEASIITLNGGDVRITASDDGVNAAGAEDLMADTSTDSLATTSNVSASASTSTSSMSRPGGPGQATNDALYIHGGTLTVNADGDGLDSNGSIYMTGGTVIVNGPTSNGNGALDYDGSFEMSGGYLVAAGSSGMAQAISDTSSQNAISMTFTEQQQAGTLVHLEDNSGNSILTFAPAKNYQSIVISSPELKTDGSYVLYSGGTSTGTARDGLYSGGTYSGGTKVVAFTASGNVTWVNESGVTEARSGMGGPGGMGGSQGGPGGGRTRSQGAGASSDSNSNTGSSFTTGTSTN
ncbi:carbohydrate-binding domain-containing protein [Paenibacillus massiliensis]|uniref:carbohydrate-binding domain-containing protein n=1 Tax=Paenibacillus massiliensis TaxID=225917 RepID=UPI00047247FE|nr:carbohydrate-binding domain-containing protein [Paenibacillus massiliensis]